MGNYWVQMKMNLILPFVSRADQFVVLSVVGMLGLRLDICEDCGSSDLCMSLSDFR